MRIEHVSDTARWVATYRAMETERPDAIFRDPYARRLAGPTGEGIVANMRGAQGAAWAMITRTAVFDEIILREVRAGADVVLNLAAGLDARPWRMELPPTLRWVDVDFPGILDYKGELLAGEKPKCKYESVRIDLRDGAARRALFASVGAPARRVLVVSEGLLIYLTEQEVADLAEDLYAVPSFYAWLIDLASPRLLKWMSRSWGKAAAKGNAPFQFAPATGTAFFKPHGWREREFRGSMEEARRIKREMRGAWIWRFLGRFYSAKRREEFRRFSGFVLLERV